MKKLNTPRLLGLILLLCLPLTACADLVPGRDDFRGGETVTPDRLAEVSAALFTTVETEPVTLPDPDPLLATWDGPVYWTSSGSVVHTDPECYHLARASEVLEGSVTIERIDYQGNKNILGINSAGQVFAESYAMTGKPLMIDVTANEDCRIFFLDIQQLKANPVQRPWVTRLLFNLVMISSRKNLELSGRSFHTVSKQIRGRVLSYLTAVSHEKGCRSFEIPLNRQQMADYLNLDRSALSGELSKMRDEGLISFHKNHFELL